MRRIEFLKKKWSKRVSDAAKRGDHSMTSQDDVFDLLLAGDPSPKKLYAEFVMRTYVNGEYLAEDVDRIRETITLFHSNKRRLPIEKRDIGNYSSERDLWTVLTEAGLIEAEELSGKAAKRSERNRAYLESEVSNADEWTMVRLCSAFAARWWGMGTRWCTTEKSGRTYKSYADRGPLRVFVSPEGVKHQLHIATNSLCDARDARVNMANFFRTLPSEFITAVRADVGEIVNHMIDPVNGLTQEDQFRYHYMSLLRLPQEFFSAEVTQAGAALHKAGIEQLFLIFDADGWELKAAKGDFTAWALQREMGISYDGNNGSMYLIVRPDGTREATDLKATSLEGMISVVGEMPPPLREAFLSKAVRAWREGDRETGVALHNLISSVHSGELSSSFWRSWAKKMGGHDVSCHRRKTPEERFGFIPSEVITENIALVFAKQGNRDRIPDSMLTRSVSVALAKADSGLRIDPEITEKFTARDIADVYGGNNGRNLGELPAEYRTYDMAKLIVDARRGALRELIKMVRAGSFDLGGRDVQAVVDELSFSAIKESASSLIDVDIPLPRSTYLEIVRRDAGMLSWVPLVYRDVEMCTASRVHSEHGLCHFPTWVVEDIRAANDGKHGITHNYRPSVKYAKTLQNLSKQEDDLPVALPPFSVKALVAELGALA